MFGVALALYALTLAPGLCWGDGARLQLDAALGGSTYLYLPELADLPADGLPFDRLGVAAWDHPLYVMLARLIRSMPLGAPAARVSAISALAAALAIALAFRVMYELAGDRVAAAAGALALAVSHTFWFHAVTAEVYALHTLFMLALMQPALQAGAAERRARRMLPFAALAGLGMANHLLLPLTAVPCAAAMLRPNPGLKPGAEATKPLALARGIPAALVFILAFAPWWVQALRMARLVGPRATVAAALATPWLPGRLSPAPAELMPNLLGYAGWLVYQFGPLGVALGVWGAVLLLARRRRAGVLLLVLFATHVLFSANYAVADRFAFHLPSYVIWALWIAVGVAELRRHTGRLVFAALVLALLTMPPLGYAAAPRALHAAGYAEPGPIGGGARDTATYFLQPWKLGEHSAETWSRAALAALPAGAHVIAAWPADQEAYLVLRYVQLVERQRPDVQLDLLLDHVERTTAQRAGERLAELAGCRPLYLASANAAYGLDRMRVRYAIVADAGMYRVQPPHWARAVRSCPATHTTLDLDRLLEAMQHGP